MDEAQIGDVKTPHRSSARGVLRILLWIGTVLQALYVGRWFLLTLLYALTEDYDPESVVQLGHLSWNAVALPAMMVSSQGPEIAVLLLLILCLVLLPRHGRPRTSPETRL